MNVIRQNKATKQWVIFATARGRRPHDFKFDQKDPGPLPEEDADCPFCAGNEARLPPVVMQMPGRNRNGWQTRVVPNKFPALVREGDTRRFRQGLYLAMPAYGRHEVVIESPRHNQQIATMPYAEIETVIETYHRRYTDLSREHKNMMVLIFRNHGLRAGTSLVHPHSQIIVTGMIPNYIRWREEEAQRYFDEWGRCVYCDILEFELQYRKRVVFENESYLGFVPFAAEVPFETWIMPKRHRVSFGLISDASKSDLARALRDVLRLLYHKLDNPDYNYIFNTSTQYKANAPHLHWYLQVLPRTTIQAGFEIGSGISINPSLPESDADFLRGEK
jgi:UDPglucose--hexose-1-phosphate uridylyltransferase